MGSVACPRCGSRQRSEGHNLCAHCLLAAALAPAPLPADDSFGNYEIVDVLGEGGMGVVYLAEQTAPFRRTVALKALKPGSGASAVAARLERERQSLARMDHPNIAAIYDAGTSARGLPYFVMEYVEGSPLTAYCDDRRLPLDARLALFSQVCLAVEHAHQRGVLHRDLKPGNILVAEVDGQPSVKVIDFGLARLEEWHTFARERLTGCAEIMGTPEYMSPEQAAGPESAVNRQTDVYALGVVLYELLSGALPFDAAEWGGRGVGEIVRLIRDVEPPPPAERFDALGERRSAAAAARGTDARSLRRALAGDLAAIVRKATEKAPARRYASAGQLAADIERYRRREPVEARRGDRLYRLGKWARRHRMALFSCALAAGTAAGAALYFAMRPPSRLTARQIVPFTALEGFESSPSFSPDGRSVVFTWAGPKGDNHDLYAVRSPGEPPRRLTFDPGLDVSPEWSPDGRQIAFVRGAKPGESRLMLLEVATGAARELATLHATYGPRLRSVAWSPDGKWLAAVDSGHGLRHAVPRLISPATGESRDLIRAPDDADAFHPAFSPDGRALAFTRDDMQSLRIWVQKLTPDYQPAGNAAQVVSGASPAWTPRGQLLYQSWFGERARLWRLSTDGGKAEPQDQFGDSVIEVAVSRDGARLALGRRIFDVDLWRYRLDARREPLRPEVVAPSTYGDVDPEISPDGARVAFVSHRSGRRQVWLAALDGSGLRQLTFGDEVRRGPNWLPDGRTLRYGTRKGEVRRFYLVDAASGRATFERDDIYLEHGSPDKGVIFFRKAVGEQEKLFRAPADGPAAPQPVSRQRNFFSRFDPAFEWIYFVDRNAGPAALWRVPAAGGAAVEMGVPVWSGCFAVSRTGVYFAKALPANRYAVYFLPLSSRAPRLLFELDKRPHSKMSVSADDRDLILSVAAQEGSDILAADIERW